MTKPIIRVYTTPSCSQCKLTKRKLDSLELEYETIDLSQSPADMEAVKELGYNAAPVIITNLGEDGQDFHWFGFRPDLLEAVAARAALAAAEPVIQPA